MSEDKHNSAGTLRDGQFHASKELSQMAAFFPDQLQAFAEEFVEAVRYTHEKGTGSCVKLETILSNIEGRELDIRMRKHLGVIEDDAAE